MTAPNHKGEAQLLSWSDTPAGRKITFLLPDEGEEHPFKGFKTGPKYGQCFAIVTQPIDYDNPEPGEATVKSVAGYAMSESQRCALLCQRGDFQGWLKDLLPEKYHPKILGLSSSEPPERIAAAVLRGYLGISSRRVLDGPRHPATRLWHGLVSKYEAETAGASPP